MSRWKDEDRLPLAKVRAEAGYTIEQTAVAVGITSRTLARYEHGMCDIPLRTAEKLADIYRVPFDTFRKAASDTWLTLHKQ